jgi:hypothetical protein
MTAARKYSVLFLTWLIATPIACAASMGVSTLWHRLIEDSSRASSEGHVLLLVIAIASTAAFTALAIWVRQRAPD